MAKLTEAQRWALQAVADGYGDSPAYLDQLMMERPGVEERRRGGNRSSAQGLGRIGGLMMARLKRMGLVTTTNRTFGGGWCPTRATLTEAGRRALAAQESQQ
jgi:hypothetical protein